jgi:hypothetical protein
MKHRIVVARWDEDVSWAKDYPHVIYDKGGGDGYIAEGETINLKDQLSLYVVQLHENPEGHESHTYLHHIITNYDRLDDLTTFVQGWPFDHARNWEREWQAEPVKGFAWVGDWMPTDDGRGKPHHIQCELPIGMAYEAIFDKPDRGEYTFIAGAQFVVSREKIRSRPRAFWEKVQALGFTPGLEKDWGYTMERLWFYILNEDLNRETRETHEREGQSV